MTNVSELWAALDRQGYIVVPEALDASRIGRLRRAFQTAPYQDGGTQHVALSQTTSESASWRALERHPILIAAAEHVLSIPFHVRVIHGRNPLPGSASRDCTATGRPATRGTPTSSSRRSGCLMSSRTRTAQRASSPALTGSRVR